MRVISGKYRRRKLINDKSSVCRPTQDRVKESLFNILSESIIDSKCLDLFCGSGSLGIEAISRGASEVVCVDKNIRAVTKNKESLGCLIRVERNDGIRFLKQCDEQFDVIFLDPPYKEIHLYEKALDLIIKKQFLISGGMVICEYFKKNICEIPKQYKVEKELFYGTTTLLFLTY